MKICTRCNTTKSKKEFNKNKSKKDGLQNYCRDCTKQVNSETYRNLPKRRNKIKERNKAWRTYNKRFLNRLRRIVGCRFCGENEPVALDFHHLDPKEKDYNISLLSSYPRETLKSEIRKCVILCSNCHRKLHAGLLEL